MRSLEYEQPYATSVCALIVANCGQGAGSPARWKFAASDPIVILRTLAGSIATNASLRLHTNCMRVNGITVRARETSSAVVGLRKEKSQGDNHFTAI